MTGPYHYKKAEDMLAEIGAADAAPDGAETALAIRAQAHALLALAAATAIDPAAGSGTSGTTSQGPATRTPSDRVTGPAAARPCQCWHLASQGGPTDPAEPGTGRLMRAVQATGGGQPHRSAGSLAR